MGRRRGRSRPLDGAPAYLKSRLVRADPCPVARVRERRSALRRDTLPSPGSQDGYALIEVLVSAILVVLVAVGIFAGFDATSSASGAGRNRATAADLAQQDQDRLRAFKVTDLTNLRQSAVHTDPVTHVAYTVASRADWVTDSTGTASCRSDTASADYLRITSTVTWPSMHGVQPVVEQSLVAPNPGSFGPNQGSLAIYVTDHAGNPLAQPVPVTVTGPKSFSDSTDSNGCLLYGYLPVGDYQVGLGMSMPGYVDNYGNTTVNQTQGVVGGRTTVLPIQYDQAATLNLSFATWPLGKPEKQQPTQADMATLIGGPQPRTFGTQGAVNSTLSTGPTLFPFSGGYSAYAGGCTAAAPPDGQPTSLKTVGPGGQASLTVVEPALNLQVLYYSRTPTPARGQVRITPVAGKACGGPFQRETDATGALTDPGVPYGTYNVCADDSIAAPSNVHHSLTIPVSVTDVRSTSVTTLYILPPYLPGPCT